MSEKNREPLEDKEVAELNDETTWERRKFHELLHDPCEQLDPVERINRRIKREEIARKEHARREEQSKLMQWVRLQIYHSLDIQKENLAGERISILKEPEYFCEPMKYLKRQLRNVTVWQQYNVNISKHEIKIRVGSTHPQYCNVYVDYYVLINKNPKKTPQDLSFRADWGQWI